MPEQRNTQAIDPDGWNARPESHDDVDSRSRSAHSSTSSTYSSSSSNTSPPQPPNASICFVCNGVHPPNRCPLLKMDEAQQARFFQSIHDQKAPDEDVTPGIDQTRSWAYATKPTKKSKGREQHEQMTADMGINKAQSWAYPANQKLAKSKKPKQPQSASAKTRKAPAQSDYATNPGKKQPDDAAKHEYQYSNGDAGRLKSQKHKASREGLSKAQSWAYPAQPHGPEQYPPGTTGGRSSAVGDITKAQSWAYPGKSTNKHENPPFASTCGSLHERPTDATRRESLGLESSRSRSSSDCSSLRFVSPSSESAQDHDILGSRLASDSSYESHNSIARKDSSSTWSSRAGMPVKSLHAMFSPEDMAYSLDVIPTLKLKIPMDDDSTIDIVDESIQQKGGGNPTNIPPRPPPVFYLWTYLTEELLHANIVRCIVALSKHASRNPYMYIVSIIALSLGLAGAGFFTNFTMIFDHEILFTPMDSLPKVHGDWITEHAGFDNFDDFMIMIHADGKNTLHVDAMKRTFEALNTVRSTPGYDDLCATSSYLNLKGKPDCWIWSTTQFWNHNLELFNEEVSTDEEMIEIISQTTFPDGTPVYKEAAYGKYTSVPSWKINEKGKNVTYDKLTYVPNLYISIGLPDSEESENFQWYALEKLKELKHRWELEDAEENPESVKLEFMTMYAYLLEYERALTKDMPLVPLTFYVMLLFTCTVFHRLGMASGKSPNGIEPSRFSLGILSTFTIGMSMTTGYGIMFCLGIPFTNLSQMVPFIILGVGLDDTFIITGAYFRKLAEENQRQSANSSAPVDERDENEMITARIGETMEEVGLSIALTTTTTTFAFCLGCFSTIPGIRWVCFYASVTIFTDFIFQITLFIAFLTLDERRMLRARKKNEDERDYLYIGNIYAKMRSTLSNNDESKRKNDKTKPKEIPSDKLTDKATKQVTEPLFTQKIMRWYANQLLRPAVRVAVLILFAGLFGFCVWRTTLLEQAFNVEDYVPEDSYTKTFFPSLSNYSSLKLPLTVYFRNVNQSDPVIQDQMREYIAALSDLPQVRQPPDFCWVRDLHAYITGEASEAMDEDQARQAEVIYNAISAGNKTFTEKLDILLNIPIVRDIYGGDLVRDEDGNILTSRCYLFVRYIDLKSIQEQTQLLFDQRQITAMYQPRIETETTALQRGEFSFFSFDEQFYYWELYSVAVDELVFTTISGVVAVNVIGFLMIPHWSATAFIFPVIIMLYFNLLGTLQLCGVFINAVTYVTIVIAIGLLVDFLMHILLRYYEATGTTREEKVKETLETMGASMLMGGFTTWLGVIPLSLSSTKVFNTIFVAFMAMVTWGLLISLVLMPVILSWCGPIVCTIGSRESQPKTLANNKHTELALAQRSHRPQHKDDKLLDDDSSSDEDSDSDDSETGK